MRLKGLKITFVKHLKCLWSIKKWMQLIWNLLQGTLWSYIFSLQTYSNHKTWDIYCAHWMETIHKIMNISRNVYKCKATDTLHAHCTQGKKHNYVYLDVAMATLSVPGLLQFETWLTISDTITQNKLFYPIFSIRRQGRLFKTTSYRPIYLNPAFIWVPAFVKRGIFHHFYQLSFWCLNALISSPNLRHNITQQK